MYRLKEQFHRSFFRRNDLHLAIIRQDHSHFQLLCKNNRLLNEKDRFGLTPMQIVKFLKPQYLYSLTFQPNSLKIQVVKEKEQMSWTKEEFEKEMEVDYLSHLVFKNDRVLRTIISRCQKMNAKGMISSKQKWLGALFENEISKGIIANVFLKWICPIKELGLFANADFSMNTFIGEYVGIVRKFSNSRDKHNPYCFEYLLASGMPTSYTIDARESGNLIRFINHSTNPNLSLHLAYCEQIMHIILLTNRPVKRGEELTYDYGSSYWEKRENPI